MNRKIRLGIILAAAIAVLAGAAYLAMIYVFPGFNPANGLSAVSGPNGKKSISVQIARATQLPPNSPDASGTLTSKTDNSLMVNNTGKGGDPANGLMLEVVVTRDTQIYRDVTFDNLSKSQIAAHNGSSLQMQVAAGTLDDIAVGDMVQAWGARTGDRVVADQVLVMQNVTVPSGQPGK